VQLPPFYTIDQRIQISILGILSTKNIINILKYFTESFLECIFVSSVRTTNSRNKKPATGKSMNAKKARLDVGGGVGGGGGGRLCGRSVAPPGDPECMNRGCVPVHKSAYKGVSPCGLRAGKGRGLACLKCAVRQHESGMFKAVRGVSTGKEKADVCRKFVLSKTASGLREEIARAMEKVG
jgi:hypothetical protein